MCPGSTSTPWPKSTTSGQLGGRAGGCQSRCTMSHRATPPAIAQPMLPEGLWNADRRTTLVGASPAAVVAVAAPPAALDAAGTDAGVVAGGPCCTTVRVPPPQEPSANAATSS